jgi:F-type H+-transporting ATPase subunit epsilon
MPATFMTLRILLPFQVFAEEARVLRIVAETPDGSFGLLPHRLDCVAVLAPGILTYETDAAGEVYVAVDDGALVKTGMEVVVSVRRAMAGTDLRTLRASVEKEFMTLDERETTARSVTARLEAGFLHRFARLQHD